MRSFSIFKKHRTASQILLSICAVAASLAFAQQRDGRRGDRVRPNPGFGRVGTELGANSFCVRQFGPGSKTEKTTGSSRPMLTCIEGVDSARRTADRIATRNGTFDGYMAGFSQGLYEYSRIYETDATSFEEGRNQMMSIPDVRRRYDEGIQNHSTRAYSSGRSIGIQAARTAFDAALDGGARPAASGRAPDPGFSGTSNGYLEVGYRRASIDSVLESEGLRPRRFRFDRDRLDDGFYSERSEFFDDSRRFKMRMAWKHDGKFDSSRDRWIDEKNAWGSWDRNRYDDDGRRHYHGIKDDTFYYDTKKTISVKVKEPEPAPQPPAPAPGNPPPGGNPNPNPPPRPNPNNPPAPTPGNPPAPNPGNGGGNGGGGRGGNNGGGPRRDGNGGGRDNNNGGNRGPSAWEGRRDRHDPEVVDVKVIEISRRAVGGIDAKGFQTFEVTERHFVNLKDYFEAGFNNSYRDFADHYYRRAYYNVLDEGQDDGEEYGVDVGKKVAFYRGVEQKFNELYLEETRKIYASSHSQGFHAGYKEIYDDYNFNAHLSLESFVAHGADNDGIYQSGEGLSAEFKIVNRGGVEANVQLRMEGSVEDATSAQVVIPAFTTYTQKTGQLAKIQSHLKPHQIANIRFVATSSRQKLEAQQNHEVKKMVELLAIKPDFSFVDGNGQVSVRVENNATIPTHADVNVTLRLSMYDESTKQSTLLKEFVAPLGILEARQQATAQITVPNLDPLLMIRARYQTAYEIKMGVVQMASREVEQIAPSSSQMALVDYFDALLRNKGAIPQNVDRSERQKVVRDEIIDINRQEIIAASNINGTKGRRYDESDIWGKKKWGATIIGKLIEKRRLAVGQDAIITEYHNLGYEFWKQRKLLKTKSFTSNESTYNDSLLEFNRARKKYVPASKEDNKYK